LRRLQKIAIVDKMKLHFFSPREIWGIVNNDLPVGHMHDESFLDSSAILLVITLLHWMSQVNYCPN
jgi:hypothetical protein